MRNSYAAPVRVKYILLATLWLFGSRLSTAQSYSPNDMKEILYGVAYYPEYMPEPRLEDDIKLMKQCGINLVRIGESTWGYQEPQDGVFNLDYLDEILDQMHQADMKVIVGTPTYAIPTWLAKKHPEILIDRKSGKALYGARQNMDISHPTFRRYAERIIRKLIQKVHDHPAVIGFQIDNETKHYGTAGENVQALFKEHLKRKFGNTDALNKAYGFHYWSNSVNNWEDLPSTKGSINGSFNSEFSKFQRLLVTDYLKWQADIVREYTSKDQFITQNFDLSWRNKSFAIQPDVDHFEAARAVDIAGIDVYHDTQDGLDGITIAFAGDLARSMKQDNYLVVETQAQSILNSKFQKLPYPGQLRLQAYSHLASGAQMIAYWPWHSIHNSAETYWKGVLSHDLQANPTFEEVTQIANEFDELEETLLGLKKNNKVAIYFSNESLSALEEFPFDEKLKYNDIVRTLYEVLYENNVEMDFVDHSVEDLSPYQLILVPMLYVAADEELERLNTFVESGGHVIYTFKSGFTDENVQVRRQLMPGILKESLGFSYQQFMNIDTIRLTVNETALRSSDRYGTTWMELLRPEGAEVIAKYEHPYWGEYAAITSNQYGKGSTTYLATWPSRALLNQLIRSKATDLGLLAKTAPTFPVVVRKGVNRKGKPLKYVFNYSGDERVFNLNGKEYDIILGDPMTGQNALKLNPWDVYILSEKE